MTCDVLGPGALDYLPCRYGTSKLEFRGPKRRLDSPYVAFLGGTLTYGRFIEQPYPLLVEHRTGLPSVNLGQPNAGVDVFKQDPVVPGVAQGARVTVMEIPGAANLNNRFYRVHTRRNDRFLRATTLLQRLFPEVDFSTISFTQHLLSDLYKRDPQRFEVMCKELQRTWLRRMGQLMRKIEGPVVLLWLAEEAPPARWNMRAGMAPRFVTRHMLDALAPLYAARVHVPIAGSGGLAGKFFNAREEPAAASMPGPEDHHRVADALLPVLDNISVAAA